MRRVILFAVLCTFVGSPAMGEPALPDILNTLYGSGNWSVYAGPDEIWYNPDGGAQAEARYAGWDQNFGFLKDDTGGTFVSLFTVAGGQGYLDGSPSALFTKGDVSTDGDGFFRFADQPSGVFPTVWSSQTSDNSDTYDHMWTYLVTSGDSAGHYVLAWEDTTMPGGDGDHQDLVVEVSGVSPVPLPAAVLLGMLGLGAAGMKLRKFV